MTNEYAQPNELVVPVRGGFADKMDKKLRRNFRAIEEWARVPHRTYGSRMVSPQFFSLDDTTHAFSAKALGTAFAGVGTDLFLGASVEIDRRMRAFVTAVGVFDNTDADTSYNAHFFLPVEVVSGAATGVRNGRHTSQYQPFGTPGRASITNIRHAYLNFEPSAGVSKTVVNFYWGWKQGNAAVQDITVYRQKMIVAMYDAPDVDADADLVWTRSATTKTAYRTDESDES